MNLLSRMKLCIMRRTEANRILHVRHRAFPSASDFVIVADWNRVISHTPGRCTHKSGFRTQIFAAALAAAVALTVMPAPHAAYAATSGGLLQGALNFLTGGGNASGGSGSSGRAKTSGGSGSSGSTAAAGVQSQSDKTFTLMVYMIGSDLESLGGAASDDIAEMLKAQYSDQLNVVIQTGGSARWANPLIDASKTQRFLISKTSGGLKEIWSSGRQAMNTPGSLTSFIQYAKSQYPADRYGLILWNHGGGTILGYGLDENNQSRMMLLSEIDQALGAAGVHFDFIGFDACMMGTLEVAFSLSDNASYLIASEETEPASGWYYPNWLTDLAKNTGMATTAIGRGIISEFMHSPDYNKWDTYTMALIDLSRARSVYNSLKEYFGYEAAQVQSDYNNISAVRGSTKAFGDGQYEQVDLIDLLGNLQGGGYDRVLAEARSCVVAFDGNVSGSNGLAVYFPYVHVERYGDIYAMLSQIGYEQDYFNFFHGFMSNLAAGQQKARNDYAGSLAATPAGNTKGGLIDDQKSVNVDVPETTPAAEMEAAQ